MIKNMVTMILRKLTLKDEREHVTRQLVKNSNDLNVLQNKVEEIQANARLLCRITRASA
jgi:hypothetical protein